MIWYTAPPEFCASANGYNDQLLSTNVKDDAQEGLVAGANIPILSPEMKLVANGLYFVYQAELANERVPQRSLVVNGRGEALRVPPSEGLSFRVRACDSKCFGRLAV